MAPFARCAIEHVDRAINSDGQQFAITIPCESLSPAFSHRDNLGWLIKRRGMEAHFAILSIGREDVTVRPPRERAVAAFVSG